MAAAQTTRATSLTLLIVDDNEALLDLISEILSCHGHEAVCAQSREEALEKLDDAAFDAALVDIWMSERADGVALAQEIKQRFPDLPVSYMSGYAEGSLSKFLPESEHKRVLHKPFRATEIMKFLEEISAKVAVA
ncbi:MAG: response regulator [Opitutales bacterium]|nr:response regulator [Opitutales bacterium]